MKILLIVAVMGLQKRAQDVLRLMPQLDKSGFHAYARWMFILQEVYLS
jgi:hypothetical protein